MANKDFQNGFVIGMRSKGIVKNKKLLKHTVTFIVNDKPYLIQSVNDGTSIKPPQIPQHNQGIFFKGWKNGNEFITFPYTPTKDIELIADFAHARSMLEVVKDQNVGQIGDTNYYGYYITRDYIKQNDGWAIGGFCAKGFRTDSYSFNGESYYFCTGGILIGETLESVSFTVGNSGKSFIYDKNGKTYYYNMPSWWQNKDSWTRSGVAIYSIPEIVNAINIKGRSVPEAILDYYYCYI